MNIALVIGTRPEAIKMAPVYRALQNHTVLKPLLVSTGQHTDLLRDALATFDLVPDFDLAIMTPGQTLAGTAARILERFPDVLKQTQAKAVLVQGDTTTAFVAGLAAHYQGIPVGHVEAGLRTYDWFQPFPEESNRQMLDRISTWCFAPTKHSRDQLLAEAIAPSRIHVTGNTGIDALLAIVQPTNKEPKPPPYVLMTLHRRESFGEPFKELLHAVLDFLIAEPKATVRWPVHPNPAIAAMADEVLKQHPRVTRLAPQSYSAFAHLMNQARLILTDSGGVQEEAPSLGKRVLVARETTERPEAVATGENRLVGRNRNQVAKALQLAWNEPDYAGPFPAQNPFGDGQASQRIVAILAHDLAGEPVA